MKHNLRQPLRIVCCVAAIAAVLCAPHEVAARVRLGSICTVYGQEEVKLVGVGVVVGLAGTGDSNKYRPAINAIAATLERMNAAGPMPNLDGLKDTKNVAFVLIQATVPRGGLRRGQTIDCYISTVGSAKSLRGGQLLATPLEISKVGDPSSRVPVALASGPIRIEEQNIQTSGVIPDGAVLMQNFNSPFIDTKRGNIITLQLDQSHQGWQSASDVATALNQWATNGSESASLELAKAIGPGAIEVKIPNEYFDDPVLFVAEVMNVGVDSPNTQARVVVNTKSQQVIFSGEVEISPVVVRSKSLTVDVGGGGNEGNGAFVPVSDPKAQQPVSTQFRELVNALNQLQAPQSEVIDIIREIHRAGKLHAVYEER